MKAFTAVNDGLKFCHDEVSAEQLAQNKKGLQKKPPLSNQTTLISGLELHSHLKVHGYVQPYLVLLVVLLQLR